MENAYMPKSQTVEWATPQDFFDKLNEEFKFTLDPCATKENAKCSTFFTKEQDGLAQEWGGYTVFCNPPYGRQIKDWVKKSSDESKNSAATVVLLVPARTDTKWFHEYVYGKAEVRFIKGRLKFGGCKDSAPFPNMVVIFTP